MIRRRKLPKIPKKKVTLALLGLLSVVAVVVFFGFPPSDVPSCVELARKGLRPIAGERAQRFQGKVQPYTGRCRGSERVAQGAVTPWVDWRNYWGTADESSLAPHSFLPLISRNRRGVDGALIDLEYQRLELIKFNLFDNYTYEEFVKRGGRARNRWGAMRLPPTHPNYAQVGGAGEQVCGGDLIRGRTLSGICNDIFNPLMGSSGTLFARNVQFEQTFPDLGLDSLARNRHGNRLALLQPDPQVISRVLFTRPQSDPSRCNLGQGLPGADASASCDYTKAPFFNVLAAFWIQFMTHDWFSHLEEGHNASRQMPMGCAVTPQQAAALGCRPGDRIDATYVAQDTPAPRFRDPSGVSAMARAPRTMRNNVTAWWDASQIYGYDETSQRRVKRDPRDPARLLMQARGPSRGEGDRQGYLPLLAPTDPMNPQWQGQEAVAFPDNWSIGMSFYHNLFVREHNIFVDEFRKQAAATPDDDSGLRNPAAPTRVIRYRDVTPEELYQAARLVVAAEIAKIHTIEWTTQLLYDEVLYKGMNANWSGLFADDQGLKRVTGDAAREINRSESDEDRTLRFSLLASGSGIVGLGSRKPVGRGPFGLIPGGDAWSLSNPQDVNGGVNHFGSPFNFPEEFITVYRLHPLVPDLIEMRDYHRPNAIAQRVPVIETVRGRATGAMQNAGLANWALSLGRQRLGALALQNHPLFLQNLPMPRLGQNSLVDVAALDIIRDRERGVPRFNEFRRQYGLRQLTSFDDFVNMNPSLSADDRKQQQRLVADLRRIYGQHRCDSTKVITAAQRDARGRPINDCLGWPNGTLVDNVEDVDMVVGWLAESTRPHGFAISETQFTVFILNASRRLFSDRFFTSSFRPEFYTKFGIDWVNNNGPTRMMERGRPNGHRQEVLPLKRVMLRAMPELAGELEHVVNVFDPWARDRGSYYSLEWKPREDARTDPAFLPRH